MLDSGPCSYIPSAGTAQNVLRAGEESLCSCALGILTLFLRPPCKQPACSSISQLVYHPSLKQSQVTNSTEHIPAPMLSLARVSSHAFFARSQQRTLAFFAKRLPCTWMQQSKRGKDSALGHTWALEQQEKGLSPDAF